LEPIYGNLCKIALSQRLFILSLYLKPSNIDFPIYKRHGSFPRGTFRPFPDVASPFLFSVCPPSSFSLALALCFSIAAGTDVPGHYLSFIWLQSGCFNKVRHRMLSFTLSGVSGSSATAASDFLLRVLPPDIFSLALAPSFHIAAGVCHDASIYRL